MKVTFYWKTRDMNIIKRVQTKFNMGTYISVNYESHVDIKNDADMALLIETEVRGFIQIRKIEEEK